MSDTMSREAPLDLYACIHGSVQHALDSSTFSSRRLQTFCFVFVGGQSDSSKFVPLPALVRLYRIQNPYSAIAVTEQCVHKGKTHISYKKPYRLQLHLFHRRSRRQFQFRTSLLPLGWVIVREQFGTGQIVFGGTMDLDESNLSGGTYVILKTGVLYLALMGKGKVGWTSERKNPACRPMEQMNERRIVVL